MVGVTARSSENFAHFCKNLMSKINQRSKEEGYLVMELAYVIITFQYLIKSQTIFLGNHAFAVNVANIPHRKQGSTVTREIKTFYENIRCYYLLIWMFHDRKMYNEIKRIDERIKFLVLKTCQKWIIQLPFIRGTCSYS